MQQRRYRPGDVLDDYCPRERRITDHAIVAMIDDHIKQTRCVVCDAEHEYKDGKVPAQRRKKPQAALFTQVLEGLTGPQPPTRVAAHPPADDAGPLAAAEAPGGDDRDASAESSTAVDTPVAVAFAPAEPEEREIAASVDAGTPNENGTGAEDGPVREEGPWRRQLIRAALPRPEGQQPPVTRPAPEFTVRQPGSNARGPRHGRRRGGGGGFAAQGSNGNHGPMRFGRGGQGQAPSQGGRRRRGRGGKKNG
jgi:hypothetical protein